MTHVRADPDPVNIDLAKILDEGGEVHYRMVDDVPVGIVLEGERHVRVKLQVEIRLPDDEGAYKATEMAREAVEGAVGRLLRRYGSGVRWR